MRHGKTIPEANSRWIVLARDAKKEKITFICNTFNNVL